MYIVHFGGNARHQLGLLNASHRILTCKVSKCLRSLRLLQRGAASDLTTPIKTLRNQFPDKYLIVAFPPHRHSKELSMAAHTSFQVGEAKLRQSHLPPSVTRQDGYRLERPDTWR